MKRTVADLTRLIRCAGSYAVGGCRDQLAEIQDLTIQHGSTPLGSHAQTSVWKNIPILLGNLPDCTPSMAEEAAKPWLGNPDIIATGLEDISYTHDHGGLFIDQDRDGVWVPSGLFGWMKVLPVPILRARWALIPDFPVPVHQVLLQVPSINTALARGDMRPVLAATTLADLRVKCSHWAGTWGRPSMRLGEVLAIGGYDALAASSILLHRSAQPLDGWHELREALGIDAEPGWAGYVLEFFGAPSQEQRLLHPARHSWISSAFEATDSCF